MKKIQKLIDKVNSITEERNYWRDKCEAKMKGEEFIKNPEYENKYSTMNKNNEKRIKTYQDLVDNYIECKGFMISGACRVVESNYSTFMENYTEEIAASKKVVKSMLAMAQISQLMPYYGGEITDEEWKESNDDKFVIRRYKDEICVSNYENHYYFLAFHTPEQRDEFLRYNEKLVRDYLMIE